MKIQYSLLIGILLIPLMLIGQNPIPNPGFENWTMGNPDNWLTNNLAGLVIPVTQSSNSHSGSSAAKLEVLSFAANPYIPILQSEPPGIPVSQRYATFSGFYQFSPMGSNDVMALFVSLQKDGVGIGFGAMFFPNTVTSYTQFNIPILYQSGEVPDTAIIHITIFDTVTTSTATIGSNGLVDDVSLSGTVPVGIVENPVTITDRFELKQNYPNPFNPVTSFEFTLPTSDDVTIIIYDISGRVIESQTANLNPGIHKYEFDGSRYSSGIYFYHIRTTSGYYQTKKMILQK